MDASQEQGSPPQEGLLVSWGCHNKVPQPGWLKTTEINFLSLLEARSQGVSRVLLLLKPPKEEPSLTFPTSGGLWKPHCHFHVAFSPSPSLLL